LDLYSFLGRLEAADAERALVGFYDHNSQALMKGKLRNDFWGDVKAEAAPVIAWFGSPDVVQIVNRHYGLAREPSRLGTLDGARLKADFCLPIGIGA